MEHIFSNSIDTFVDENTLINVKIDNIVIFQTRIKLPNFTGESIELSKEEEIKSFEDNNSLEYQLYIVTSFGNISYDLYCEEVCENFEIELITSSEESNLPLKSYINAYVPLIKYTNSTKELIFKTIEHANNKEIIPLLDIRKEKNILKYIDEDFNMKHFLDLCEVTVILNEEERTEIKSYRKGNRGKVDLPDIPAEEEYQLPMEKVLEKYIEINKISKIIPVWRIDTSSPANLNDGLIANNFSQNFDSIVIRVVNTKNFIVNIQSYLLPLIPIFKNSYIIIEFTGLNDKEEQSILSNFISLKTNIQIIYAKETTDFANHTISRNYPNIFPNTSLSSYIDRLTDSSNNLFYSDYCGYDRNTAIEFIPGMKPNVSLYLLDKNDGFEIFIFKIKHQDEIGTPSWKKSAELLLRKINSGEINNCFLESNHCAGCSNIFTTKNITLTKAKNWSMLHNCITIAKL